MLMTQEEFEEAVGDALDAVPAELLDLMDNVVFLCEDEPPAGDPDLLGVYDGVPLTERDGFWAAGSLPDRITIFRGPTLRMCATRDEVLHEVARHRRARDRPPLRHRRRPPARARLGLSRAAWARVVRRAGVSKRCRARGGRRLARI